MFGFQLRLINGTAGDTFEIQRDRNHHVTFVRFKVNPNRKLTDGATLLPKIYPQNLIMNSVWLRKPPMNWIW
jgi:hypothetical protein